MFKVKFIIGNSAVLWLQYSVVNNMLNVNNKNTDVFIVNSEHISHLVLVFLLLTLNM